MTPKDLQQLLKETFEAKTHTPGEPVDITLTTVSVEIDGVIRIVDIVAKEVGTFNGLTIGV